MKPEPENSHARIELVPAAKEHEPVIENLLDLYAHDFSEFYAVELRPDGRFGYKNLSLYWRDPHRRPFLVRVDGRLAGFVLTQEVVPASGKETGWDMTEFFVARGFRRQGVGTAVAHKLWERFPGRWEIRVMEANTAAHHFWQKAIADFTGVEIESVRTEKTGQAWRLFAFDSRKKL